MERRIGRLKGWRTYVVIAALAGSMFAGIGPAAARAPEVESQGISWVDAVEAPAAAIGGISWVNARGISWVGGISWVNSARGISWVNARGISWVGGISWVKTRGISWV